MQFIFSDIFKFQNDQCLDDFDELFCPVGENGVIIRVFPTIVYRKVTLFFLDYVPTKN